MNYEAALLMLGLLEAVTLGIATWVLKSIVANGKTLTYLKTKLTVICDRTADHEDRLRHCETSKHSH
jgi:hypothetical protein